MTTPDRGTGTSTVSWADLPATVTRYIDAHRDGDDATALGTFAQDAAVTDEGHTYRGRDEIQHLEGNFPGGTADLHYRFAFAGDRIARLVIEP